MATRTIKLIGKAYGVDDNVTLTVNFNNIEVFSGNVATTVVSAPAKGEAGTEICSWTVDTSLSGNIPMSISVTGGDFSFNDLLGNYVGFELEDASDNPDDGWKVVDNNYVLTTAPVDMFGVLNVNTSDSDGKDNVTYSGPVTENSNPERSVIDANESIGDWVYTIEDGQTFSCDFRIDASLLTLDSDVPVYTAP